MLRILFLCAGLIVPTTVWAEPVHHVVVVWLRAGTPDAVRQMLMKRTEQLAEIEGIESIHTGEPLPSSRPVVDDSFSFAVTFIFRSKQAMNAYLQDRRHQQFIANEVKPHLDHLLIYDY